MKKRERSNWIYFALVLLFAIALKIFSAFPYAVEKWYYEKIYPVTSGFLRIITGWLPFSLGDILYAFVVIWLLIQIIKSIRRLVKRQVTRSGFFKRLRRIVLALVWVYIIFYFNWGLNYSRLGIAYQLQLDQQAYTTDTLQSLVNDLIQRVNSSRRALGDSAHYDEPKRTFQKAAEAYNNLSVAYPFMMYKHSSVKSSMYGKLGNYLGFLGYYNPFTGEAQVNTAMPAFLIPYTTCHEIGHQLGYGSEDEANFSGYLAAIASNDMRFHYSAYFDLFNYANSQLFMRDSVAARNNYRQLDTLVKLDILTYKKFIIDHKNPVEPLIDIIYGNYLQANNQPNGLETYDEVVGWLIAYRKKYGKL